MKRSASLFFEKVSHTSNLTCSCSHTYGQHRKGGDCLATIDDAGRFCRCKQFTLPITEVARRTKRSEIARRGGKAHAAKVRQRA